MSNQTVRPWTVSAESTWHVTEPRTFGDCRRSYSSDAQHCEIVARYFRLAGGWTEPVVDRRLGPNPFGDPLYAVWAHRA